MAATWKKLAYADDAVLRKPRILSTASLATPAPDVDLYDFISLTAQAEAVSFGAPTGTPGDGQRLLIRVKDDGTARAITWNAIYNGDLPTTTVVGETIYVIFLYNTAASKWDAAPSGEPTGGGHTIVNESDAEMTARGHLHFTGAGVAVTDVSGDDATVVTIAGVGLFELDVNGDLEPILDTVIDYYYDLDINGDIQPKNT